MLVIYQDVLTDGSLGPKSEPFDVADLVQLSHDELQAWNDVPNSEPYTTVDDNVCMVYAFGAPMRKYTAIFDASAIG